VNSETWNSRSGLDTGRQGCNFPRMSIMTGRGDEGETDLLFGRRIAKTALRMGALGTVDELNSALGVARAAGPGEEIEAVIDGVQTRLVGLMGQLACLPQDLERYEATGFVSMTAADVDWLVASARVFEARGVKFTGWARPGAEGSVARAALDFARSVARRAERAILALHESGEEVPEAVRLFFNRASDVMWIMARAEA
jgi:cob(I)alamin adenosyltransferase